MPSSIEWGLDRILGPIQSLIKKEFLIDYKDRQVWLSVLLYIISTNYLVYQSFQSIKDAEIWNTLLWIILLFAAFNVVSRSYDQERGDRELYLFMVASPQQVIAAKMIYHSLFMVVMTLLSFFIFSFFIPFPNAIGLNMGLYLLGLVGGALGLSTSLGLTSALAWKAKGGSGMVAILGMPIIIPLLISAIGYSEGVVNGMTWLAVDRFAYAILVLILLSASLGYLLFPYIWRD
ncbi:MAG: heme exporter protein CcmB [Bacteroidetes bacterium]|nr:heme exporter protein CcmB [Bacteroidota bacterium]